MTNAIAAFVIIMSAIWSIGWWANRLTRTRREAAAAAGGGHGEAARRIEHLVTENASLKGQVGRLEQRLAVLERIATDPAERTAREIESLR
ncbi:MAG TPA: hypothetical protein VN231_13785 [Allosphingosinicella sp.]|nr:hypothetical protein [Allosphingosinicella sp.]